MLWLLGETSLCSSTSPRPAAPPSIACSARKGPRWPTTLRLALTLASTLTLTLTPNPDPDPNPNPNQLVNYLGFQCFAWIFGAFFGAAVWSKCTVWAVTQLGSCASSGYSWRLWTLP